MTGEPRGPHPLRVLIVDDSASVRQALTRIIEQDRGFEVMGAVGDPFAAADRMRREAPDVILLDLELPRMDGLTFLRKLMAQRPTPVVVCSSLTEANSAKTLEALEAGAVEAIAKPRANTARSLEEHATQIRGALRAAACARLRGGPRRGGAGAGGLAPMGVEPRHSADAMIPPISPGRLAAHMARIPVTEPVLCIGASTGGTEALQVVMRALPADAPPVLIVQHMPEHFTAAFARRLDGASAMEVREARDGDALRRGLALLAPGGRHLMLRRQGMEYRAIVQDGPLVARHRPSVDVLFRSAAQAAGPNAVAAILTGMGDDGAEGMLELRASGASTIAQDEATCVVYGMPKEAKDRGGARLEAALDRIGGMLLTEARGRTPAGRA